MWRNGEAGGYHIVIKGKKVALRAIEKEDLPLLMEWRNNPEYRQYFREYRELNSVSQERWFQNIRVH